MSLSSSWPSVGISVSTVLQSIEQNMLLELFRINCWHIAHSISEEAFLTSSQEREREKERARLSVFKFLEERLTGFIYSASDIINTTKTQLELNTKTIQ